MRLSPPRRYLPLIKVPRSDILTKPLLIPYSHQHDSHTQIQLLTLIPYQNPKVNAILMNSSRHFLRGVTIEEVEELTAVRS